MNKEFTAVGKRITQKDVVLKATGEAIFVPDVKLQGQLWGKILHSKYAHAKFTIDKTRALALPGVVCVITYEDTPKIPYCRSFRDMPMTASGQLQHSDEFILADKARFVGDPIAAVAAVDEKTAEAAIELLEADVKYEVLPFVIDPRDALKPGAPVIHDYSPNNNPVNSTPPPWLAIGDLEKGFAESDLVVEDNFYCSRQIQSHLETQSCCATVDSNNKITVYSPNQLAHPFRRELGKMFNHPVGKINVVTPYVGGSFGCRLSCHTEPICVMLALKTRKPVKLVNSKEEDFTTIDARTPHYLHAKLGLKKDGTLHAMELNVTTWGGGYVSRAMLAGGIMLIWGLGHYRCPNMNGSCKLAYTNTPLGGAMRGFGNPEVMWGIDQLMDRACVELGLDPVEMTLKNTKHAGETCNTGLPIESTYIDDCINEGAKAIGWKEKRGKNKGGTKTLKRGVGMSTMTHCSGAWPLLLEHSGAIIKFNEDGSANLIINPGSPGTHIYGSLSQVAAEVLGISVDDIYVVAGETEKTLFDLGSHASRSMYVTGHAVRIAAEEARKELLAYAAKMLAETPDDLDIKDGQVFVKANPGKKISVAKVSATAIYGARGDGHTISGKGCFVPHHNSPPTAAYFAEVEVDTETGVTKVLNFVSAVDCGKAINPMTVEGQCEGGVQQGLGYGLTEDYVFNPATGATATGNFTTYKIPGAPDMPLETKIIIIDKPDPKGPFGAKGVGEPGLVGIAPAIMNAIHDAVGVRVTDLPIKPEAILKALKEKASK